MGTNTNPDQFNIRWKNYTLVLQSVFRELLEDERLVDCTLACEGGSIKCHRIVLTACSSYFEKLLSQYPSQNHIVIFMKDLKQWELQALVHFMYNGEVSVKQNRLAPLVRAAESLRIRGLSSENDQGGHSDSDADKMDEENDEMGDMEEYHHHQKPLAHNKPVVSSRPHPSMLGKSLLRPGQQHPQSSHHSSSQRGLNINNNKKMVHVLKRPLSNGPPKLVKMQKFEEKQINDGGVMKSSSSPSGSGSVVAKSSNQPKSQSSHQLAVDGASSKMKSEDNTDVTGEEEEEDGFPHEAEVTGEIEDEYDENGELQANTQDDDDAECDASGSDEMEESSQAPAGGRRVVYKYGKEIRDSALAALNTGLSLRQCSEAFGIPRKTLSKWRCREVATENEEAGDGVEGEEEVTNATSLPVVIREPPMTAPVIDATDRANRLKKATELALAGVTVRQAAAHYGIPRTTLCAYMKRRGLTGKRMFTPPSAANARRMIMANRNRVMASSSSGGRSVQNSASSNQVDGFPFLGLSDLVDEMQENVAGGGVYDEDAEQDFEDDETEADLSPKEK